MLGSRKHRLLESDTARRTYHAPRKQELVGEATDRVATCYNLRLMASHVLAPFPISQLITSSPYLKMYHSTLKLFLLPVCLGVSRSAKAEDYQPQLFARIKLVYEDHFDTDGKHQRPEQWVIRHNTNWNVNNGILTGGLADVTYQKMMQQNNDGHDGTRTVIFLKPVPKACVIQMRVR